MGTPARKNILDNVGTVLNTITTGNGYKTTLATVEAFTKGWGDMGSGAKPFVGYAPGPERLQFLPGNQIRVRLDLIITCHISGTTQDARSVALNNLLDDLIAALNLDTTRGGHAVSTTITQAESDEGSPDANHEGSMLVRAEVVYFRNTSSS